ncbi:Transforming growth factor beta activator LRRC33 [Aphelenchoides bicaudatus]|nr:Transforming growth factor beta activator LRRC33 [Aphelenchoides bicaudatus]
MLPRLLFGLLAFCLVVQSRKLWHTHSKEIEDERRVVLCENSLCSCYVDDLKIDCRGQVKNRIFNGRYTKFNTPSDNFYPRVLDLSGNGIRNFNASNFLTEEQCRHVETLDLSDNELRYPDLFNLDAFENLRVLNLSRNGLELYRYRYNYGNREAFNWTSTTLFDTVEVLDLSHNSIEFLPNKLLSKFKKLKRIILDGNRLADVEESGYQVDTVEELSINDCSQGGLHERFKTTFPNVKKLWARHNTMYDFPELSGFKNLKFLDLSNNRLDCRRSYYYRSGNAKVNGVETLLLSNNNFYGILDGFFSSFPNLTVLDLSNNYIYKFDRNSFHYTCRYGYGECKLRELSLEGCQLSSLSVDMLDWKKLTSLKVKGNRFTCNTDLSWLILDKSIPIETGADQATCHDPAALEGRKLRDVKEEELQNPTETAVMYYFKQALDFITRDQQLFFFGLGVLSACLVILALRCCYCCLCCCVRRVDQKFVKLQEDYDRRKLLQRQASIYKPEEDTQTIAETIPDE